MKVKPNVKYVAKTNKQTYREKHREILRKKLEINKEYSKQMTECSACKVMIQKSKMKRHEQTGTHLHNLNHPNNLKLTYKQQHEQKQKQQEQQQKQPEEEKEARRKRPPKDSGIPQRKLSHIPLWTANRRTNPRKNSNDKPFTLPHSITLKTWTLLTKTPPQPSPQKTSKTRNTHRP